METPVCRFDHLIVTFVILPLSRLPLAALGAG